MRNPSSRSRSRRSTRAVLLGLAGALTASGAFAAQDSTSEEPAKEAVVLALRAERVIVRPGKVVDNATVIVQDGEIVAVGTDVDVPDGAQIIEGSVVCAAFMDPWSTAGVDAGSAADGSIDASTRAVDALDPYAQNHARDRMVASGVLLARTQVGAEADLGGVGAVIRAHGVGVVLEDASVSAAIGVPRNQMQQTAFGTFSFGPQPVDPIDCVGQVDRLAGLLASGKKYGEDQAEYVTELAEWEKAIAEKEKELEDDFKKAKKARDKKVEDAKEDGKEHKDKRYKEDKRPRAPKFDADKATFARVVNGEVPLVVYADRALAIRELLKVTEPFDRMRLVVAGGTSALAVADQLADRSVPVIVSPSPAKPGGPIGRMDPGLSLAAELDAAGVTVLIGSAGGADASRDLPLLAALAVGHGMDRDAALEAITLGPARTFDVSGQVGEVRRGRAAELLVLSGDPLASTTRVLAAISGGDVVHRSDR